MRGTQPRNEQGSALVMALVMLTVIGLLVGAALTYAARACARPTTPSARTARRSTQPTARSRARSSTSATTPRCRATSSARSASPNFYRYTDPKVGDVTVDACPQYDSLIYEGSFRAVLLTLGETATDGIISATTATWTSAATCGRTPRSISRTRRTWSMNGGRVWAWGSCNRPGNIEMPPGVAAGLQRQHEPDSVAKPKVALDPADPIARPRRRLAARGGAGIVRAAGVPGLYVPNTMTLQPGVYYGGDEFSDQDQRVRQRHAEPRRLLPQLPGRRRRMGASTRTSSARRATRAARACRSSSPTARTSSSPARSRSRAAATRHRTVRISRSSA